MFEPFSSQTPTFRIASVTFIMLLLTGLFLLLRDFHTAGLFLMSLGAGALGAAWSRWTEGPHWLSFYGITGPPDHMTVLLVLTHIPALFIGMFLVHRYIGS